MNTLHQIADLAQLSGPLALGIGVFDGVHLGHRAVIEATLIAAKAVAGTPVLVTFDPHPARVLRPENPPRLLTSTGHKLRLLQNAGVENVLMVEFNREFAENSPNQFIDSLADNSRPLHAICVGEDWAFGKNRSGNVDFMRSFGQKLGYSVIAVPPVVVAGKVVSSTLIRHAVEAGHLNLAADYLGRPYTILGTVVSGRQLGRTIGYPTANLSAHSEQFPPYGVYAICAEIEGQYFGGVANIGIRPTLENRTPGPVLEVHLFDFQRDIYGMDMEISFEKFLRPEQKFVGLDELRSQISLDAESARNYLASI